MKLLLAFTFLVSSLASLAQTKAIAHKSHSGKINTMNKGTRDNFGLNPDHYKLHVDSIERISPTLILFYKQSYRDEGVLRDSIFLNTNPNNLVTVLDSLKKVYPKAKFKGFDTAVRSKKKNIATLGIVPFKQSPPSGMPALIAALTIGVFITLYVNSKSLSRFIRGNEIYHVGVSANYYNLQ
jgi:hypothetical protein